MHHSGKSFPALLSIQKHKVEKWYVFVAIAKTQNKKKIFFLNTTGSHSMRKEKKKTNMIMYADIYRYTFQFKMS